MALEIADGMAYLSVRKYVHRYPQFPPLPRQYENKSFLKTTILQLSFFSHLCSALSTKILLKLLSCIFIH